MINDPKNSNHSASTAKNSAELAREHKLAQDKKDAVERATGHIVSEKNNLSTEEDTLLRLRIQLNKIRSQSMGATVNSAAVINIKSIEQQAGAKIDEAKRRMQALEAEAAKLDENAKSTSQTLAEKKRETDDRLKGGKETASELIQMMQEEKKEAELISRLEEEIRLKTSELEGLEREHDEKQKEIADLKKRSTTTGPANDREQLELKRTIDQATAKASMNRKEFERLNVEVSSISRDLELKKQAAEKANKDALEKDLENQLKQAEIRVKTYKDNIKYYENEIQKAK
ncbi:TPA: hypothetical protein DCQ44_02310 [Candidatus Taylorbacteria bacterium]|nr:hypothetical protein [Candidatus Taylorbacteria bacterium]